MCVVFHCLIFQQKEESLAAGHPLLHTTFEEGEDLLKRVRAQGGIQGVDLLENKG
jgi:hypothetical protein